MIQLLCWEGYESPRVLEPFERRGSTRVHARTLLSDAGTAEDLVAGRTACDVLNINNAWIRGSLHPAGLVRALDRERFEPHFERMLPEFSRLYAWARDGEGALIGICQRFGPFNLVVNTNRIDRASAEDQGLRACQRFGPTPLRHPALRGLQPLSRVHRGRTRPVRAARRGREDALRRHRAALVRRRHHRHRRPLRAEPGAGRRHHRLLPERRYLHRVAGAPRRGTGKSAPSPRVPARFRTGAGAGAASYSPRSPRCSKPLRDPGRRRISSNTSWSPRPPGVSR